MRIPLFSLLVVTACSAPLSRLAAPFQLADTTVVGSFGLVHDLTQTSEPGLELSNPLSVRSFDGHIAVADRSTDRVAVYDNAGRFIRWIGTRGRGPGELYGVGRLATGRGRIFVAEALNGRVSEFTTDGRFVRTHTAPFAAGALATTKYSVVIAARSASHYAARVAGATDPVPLLSRYEPARGTQRSRWTRMPGHDLLSGDSTQLWTFDQGAGVICQFSESQQAGVCRQLPSALLNRLQSYRDERVIALELATRQHVQAAPLAKDMIRFGSYLALLLPLPEFPLALINTDDGVVTLVSYLGDAMPDWARRATGFDWDGNRFVLVSDEGIGRFHVPTLHTFR